MTNPESPKVANPESALPEPANTVPTHVAPVILPNSSETKVAATPAAIEPPVDAPVPPTLPEPVKSKLTRRTATAFKPPQIGPHNGNFFVTFVDQSGEEHNIPATEEVYRWSTHQNPEFDCHADWIINMDEGKAVGVIRKPHLRQVLPSQLATDDKNLVMVKAGQSYEPVHLPNRFDVALLDEVIALLSKTQSFRPGEKLGRFIIKKVAADTENTFVSLDLQ